MDNTEYKNYIRNCWELEVQMVIFLEWKIFKKIRNERCARLSINNKNGRIKKGN